MNCTVPFLLTLFVKKKVLIIRVMYSTTEKCILYDVNKEPEVKTEAGCLASYQLRMFQVLLGIWLFGMQINYSVFICSLWLVNLQAKDMCINDPIKLLFFCFEKKN